MEIELLKRRSWIFLLGVGTMLIIVLNLPMEWSQRLKGAVRELLAPLQGLLSTTGDRVQDAGKTLRGIGDLPAENADLRHEIAQLENTIRELEQLEEENIRLRTQLDFRQRSPQVLLPSEVLSRDISGWWHSIRIAHPRMGEVRENQAVVNSDGLVGRVTSTSPNTVDVLLISDPACRVAVRVGASRAHGLMRGQGLTPGGTVLCRMDLINKNLRISRGDKVVTSGMGGLFPEGLFVGYVDSVEKDASGLFQTAQIRPKVQLGDLRTVFVISRPDAEIVAPMPSPGEASP